MSRYWSALVHQLTPYVPGEQPKLSRLVKLNTNESPYPPSPHALAAIQAATNDSLRLYPDPNGEALKQAVARREGLNSAEVFVGNGSDEVLAHVFMALLKHERPLLFPDISYSFYPVYCGLYGIQPQTVALTEDFAIRADDYLPGAACPQAGGIIFPNPNAPTGRALPRAEVERILAGNPEAVVVVDEAYVDFGAESATSLIHHYPNLLVVQTLSKSRALAGLRVGFAMGQAPLIEALERVKNSFNSYPLDRLALAGAVAAIEDERYFADICARVVASRQHLTSSLETLGFSVLPSSANFVFACHPTHDAAAIAAYLREQGIIVRHFKLPRIEQYLRISIGTEEECGLLVNALQAHLGTP